MKYEKINTKQIRNDLHGFLNKLKSGQTIQVIYRSKPLVTLAAQESKDLYLADDAGTPQAAQRSIDFLKQLPARPISLDPKKSFKDLYNETQD